MKAPLRCEVPVGKIDLADTRFKFRKSFKSEALKKKMDSISEAGLLNPVKLWKQGDSYTIIAGWQRTQAVITLGSTSITADVYEGITFHEALMINIADNSLRENLSDFEVACQMYALKTSDDYSVEKIAELYHCGVDRVYDMLSTFDMDRDLRNAFERGELTLYKAVVLGRFSLSERSEILRKTIEEGRSTRWLREELSRRKGPHSTTGSGPVKAESAAHASGDHQGSLHHEVESSGAILSPTEAALKPRKGGPVAPQAMRAKPVSVDKIVLVSSLLFEKLLEWYPYEVVEETWETKHSDDMKYFPVIEELRKITKRREKPETLITRVLGNMVPVTDTGFDASDAMNASAGDPERSRSRNREA